MTKTRIRRTITSEYNLQAVQLVTERSAIIVSDRQSGRNEHRSDTKLALFLIQNAEVVS